MFSDNPEMTSTRNEGFAKRLHGIPHPEEFRRGIPTSRAIHVDHTNELQDMIGPEFLFQLLNVQYD